MAVASRLREADINSARFNPSDFGYFCCGTTRDKITSTICLIAFAMLITGIIMYSRGKHFAASVTCLTISPVALLILCKTSKKERDSLSPALLEQVKRKTAANVIAGIFITHPNYTNKKLVNLPSTHLELGFTDGNLDFRAALQIRDIYAHDIKPNAYQINKQDNDAIDAYCKAVLAQLEIPDDIARASQRAIDNLMEQARTGIPKGPARSTQLLQSGGASLGDQLASIDDLNRRAAFLEEHHAKRPSAAI